MRKLYNLDLLPKGRHEYPHCCYYDRYLKRYLYRKQSYEQLLVSTFGGLLRFATLYKPYHELHKYKHFVLIFKHTVLDVLHGEDTLNTIPTTKQILTEGK